MNDNVLDADLLSAKVQVINPGVSHIDSQYLKTLYEIFNGGELWSSRNVTPSLPVASLIRQLYGLQNELLEFHDDYRKTGYYGSIISHIDFPYNIYTILRDIPVYAVREDELGQPHKVHNIFTRAEETVNVPTEGAFDENVGTDYFGVYIPDTGRIYIRIEKIINEVSNIPKEKLYPSILYQKVLLHEFIHLLLDVLSRNLGTSRTVDKDYLDEETVDNYLVLMCYANSTCKIGSPSSSFEQVRRFIESQPSRYREACSVYDENTSWLTGRNIIKNLMITKSKKK